MPAVLSVYDNDFKEPEPNRCHGNEFAEIAVKSRRPHLGDFITERYSDRIRQAQGVELLPNRPGDIWFTGHR